MALLLTSSRWSLGRVPSDTNVQLTFYLSNSAEQDFFLGLLILDASENLLNDVLGKVGLLALLDLLLISNPAVQDRLHLSSDGNFLLLDEGLGFEDGGFLQKCCQRAEAGNEAMLPSTQRRELG